MRQRFAWLPGIDGQDARELFANLLLMGDGYDGDDPDPTSESYTSPSARGGYGRLRAYTPDAGSLTVPFSWDSRKVTVFQGQTTTIPVGSNPLSTNVEQLKWAWLVDWPTLQLAPVIDARVVATLGSGCTPPYSTVSLDDTYVLRGRRDIESNYFLGGRCVFLELEGIAVPSGGVEVYSAYYYHGGPTDGH